MPFARQCEYAAALGYQGLEVAPYTLADDPLRISAAEARRCRDIAADLGLVVCGLHWLLVKPEGLSITSPDAALRARTALNQFGGAVEALDELEKTFGYTLGPEAFENDPSMADLLLSSEYETWLASREPAESEEQEIAEEEAD